MNLGDSAKQFHSAAASFDRELASSTVIIGSLSCNASVFPSQTSVSTGEFGGYVRKKKITVSVYKTDLPGRPVEGTLVQWNGERYMIDTVAGDWADIPEWTLQCNESNR